ncbi:hypothetical protein [Streptomyces sp. N35]|uniref:hypothetical protein n=1 Tax=Streptomyces sp. N35 TaxID=2795730 RepID=UPI0027DE23B9|nr:hypothetical protein [Streptomyces sp. N35]
MLLLIPLVVIVGSDSFRAALDFTTGVLSLVSLTCSIVWGLVASDSLFLSPKQRLLAQGVHRATAIAALGFLLLHGTVKLVLGHVSVIGALIPFGLGVTGTDGLIGFGALAGLLMIVTGVTGAMRSSFASPARIAGRWRALHILAYPAWCSALVHGLYAGRQAAPWVVAMYCLCLAGVTGALALRAAPLPVKRKVARRILVLLDAQTRIPRVAAGATPRREGPLPGMEALAATSGAGSPRAQLPQQQGGFTSSYEGERPRAGYEEERPRAMYEEEPSRATYEEERPRTGSGMAAAYRAVSTAPGARPLPLQEEHSGRWPHPSPPPPGEAARPAPPAYPSGTTPYDTAASPGYDTGPVPTYDTSLTEPVTSLTEPVTGPAAPFVPTAPVTPAQSSDPPYYVTSDPYDTGSTPTYGSGPISPYDTGQTPLYEAPTEPIPNPFEAPAAGEPWSAPGTAGGRR